MILDYKLYLLFICSINVFEWYFKVTNYCESFFNGCVDFTMVCFLCLKTVLIVDIMLQHIF